MPENIPPTRALAVVDKPREAEVIQPFKKGTYVPSPVASGSGAKRMRVDSESETGKNSNIFRNNVQNSCTSYRKYDVKSKISENLLVRLPDIANRGYISAAYSHNTWKRISLANNCLKNSQNTPTHTFLGLWALTQNYTSLLGLYQHFTCHIQQSEPIWMIFPFCTN